MFGRKTREIAALAALACHHAIVPTPQERIDLSSKCVKTHCGFAHGMLILEPRDSRSQEHEHTDPGNAGPCRSCQRDPGADCISHTAIAKA